MPVFKQCPFCSQEWNSVDEFINDRKLKLIGYQVDFSKLSAGYFLFNHHCGDTLALEVAHFTHLYHGPVYKERKTGQEECPGYCLHNDNLSPCPAHCECAFVREIMQILQK